MPFTDTEANVSRPRNVEVTQDNYPKYKAGANYSDINKIKEYDKMGYDHFQIAHFTGLVEACVAGHLKPPRQKPGPKPREQV